MIHFHSVCTMKLNNIKLCGWKLLVASKLTAFAQKPESPKSDYQQQLRTALLHTVCALCCKVVKLNQATGEQANSKQLERKNVSKN